MKVLVVDIGNNNCKSAVWNGKKLSQHNLFPTDTLDEISFSSELPLVVSCVIPSLRKKNKRKDIFWISSELNTGVDFSQIANGIGADRVAAAAAVAKFAKKQAIIVDAGTAITVDALSHDKVFLGGAIMPGLQMMNKSLYTNTAALPLIKKKSHRSATVFAGKNTISAIRSGIEHGLVGAVRYLINGIAKECEFRNFELFISGGDASLFVKHFQDSIYVKNIVLLGSAIIWERERNKNES